MAAGSFLALVGPLSRSWQILPVTSHSGFPGDAIHAPSRCYILWEGQLSSTSAGSHFLPKDIPAIYTYIINV